MAYLGTHILVWSVAAAAFAAYLQYTGYQPLKSSSSVEAELNAYNNVVKAPDTFIVYAGRLLFIVVVLAWIVEICQALRGAVKRHYYKPTALPQLQPLQQQQQQLQQQQAELHAAPADAQQESQTLVNQHRNESDKASTSTTRSSSTQRETELEERRRQAAEARQRELDAATALIKEQQRQQELEQQARAEATAAHAAEQRRLRERMQQAAREEVAQDWRQWEQAVLQQYSRPADITDQQTATAVDAQRDVVTQLGPTLLTQDGFSMAQGTTPATAAAAVAEDRELRSQQDQEYQASLAADQQQALRGRQRQLLKKLKVVLQQSIPEPPEAADLTVRVKLPDGSTSTRQFAGHQPLCDIYDWVFSLSAMPCLPPGSWFLATTFPKHRLAAAAGIWALGGCSAQSDVEQYIQQRSIQCSEDAASGTSVPEGWTLTVRQLNGEEVKLTVNDDLTILKVKHQLTLLTGVPCAAQRLIFAGHVLSDSPTLHQLGVTKQHTLQMAPKVPSTPVAAAAAPQSTSTSEGSAAMQEGGEEAQVDSTASEGNVTSTNSTAGQGDVLVLADVKQLKEQVAQGAAQLALYVMITQPEP